MRHSPLPGTCPRDSRTSLRSPGLSLLVGSGDFFFGTFLVALLDLRFFFGTDDNDRLLEELGGQSSSSKKRYISGLK